MGFQDLAVVKILVVAFWVLMPCSLVGGYQNFGGTYYSQSALKVEVICFSEMFVTAFKITFSHNLEDHSPNNQYVSSQTFVDIKRI
jgi:hypothetical protein